VARRTGQVKAQPELQKGIGFFWARLILGATWSVWHYWPVLTPADGNLSGFVSSGFLTWLAYELSNSVLIAWLRNNTEGSLPIAGAAHAGLTLGQNLVDFTHSIRLVRAGLLGRLRR
jgi:hypothetical protein